MGGFNGSTSQSNHELHQQCNGHFEGSWRLVSLRNSYSLEFNNIFALVMPNRGQKSYEFRWSEKVEEENPGFYTITSEIE